MAITNNHLNITEAPELGTQVVPVLFPEHIARAKEILAKHPLPPQILEVQAANPEGFREKANDAKPSSSTANVTALTKSSWSTK